MNKLVVAGLFCVRFETRGNACAVIRLDKVGLTPDKDFMYVIYVCNASVFCFM